MSPVRALYSRYLPAQGPLVAPEGLNVLGVLEHGADPHPPPAPDGVPVAMLAMEVLSGEPVREVWLTPDPVRYGEAAGIRYARSAGWLFGVARCPADEPDPAAQRLYGDLIRLTRRLDAGPLLRLWNYFPGINREQAGLERYRHFCAGRYEALAEAGFSLAEDLPAASAIGAREGDLWVIFLAGRGAATQIENPRQISAFRYPPEYGPRSPSFSRAVRHDAAGGPGLLKTGQASLFISGTASILGHRTVREGDPLGQCETTLDNLRALLAQAGLGDPGALGARAVWKVYLRRPGDYRAVRACLDRALDRASPILYLAGDICREALLLEIEGWVTLGD
jgi:chorismate lyase/3-hydroxybenzoate synthase